jgi:hypothetical protein
MKRRSKKPWVSVPTNSFDYKDVVYDTYAELKKNLKKHIQDSWNGRVSVTRTRRGEWGQWFEKWMLNFDGKPHITKQTWL